MMGVTFASVGPMLAMAGGRRDVGLLGIYGSVIAAGIFGFVVAPFMSQLLPLFPAGGDGLDHLVIGISLMRIGVNWAGGGLPMLTKVVDGVAARFPIRATASSARLGIAVFVLLVCILPDHQVRQGLLRQHRGAARHRHRRDRCAGARQDEQLREVVRAVVRHRLSVPVRHADSSSSGAIVTMCIVMIVVMIESTGMFLALGEMTGRTITEDDMTRGLRTDGVGTLLGGIFNTFPYTSFSQNVGLVGVTGVRSRWVTVAGGIILLALGLSRSWRRVVAAVPPFVLGGAGIVMFGMVAATGIRILPASTTGRAATISSSWRSRSASA